MAPVLNDEKPELGDLIEIDRGFFQHWAIYVGDGFVVHLVLLENSVMSVLTQRAVVKKEQLWDVVGTDKWTINNRLDKKYKPRPCGIIVKEACALVGQERPYCVISANCEHFVNELRYGKAESRQVHQAAVVVLAAGVAGVVIFVIVALAGGSRSKSKSKK